MRPDELEALWKLAYLFLQCGQPARAACLLDGLDAAVANEATTLRLLAWSQVRSGQAAQALDTLDRLALVGSSHPTLDLLRSQALSALGRHEAAHELMTRVLVWRQRVGEESPTPGTRADSTGPVQPLEVWR